MFSSVIFMLLYGDSERNGIGDAALLVKCNIVSFRSVGSKSIPPAKFAGVQSVRTIIFLLPKSTNIAC